jgi:hypothetical protein
VIPGTFGRILGASPARIIRVLGLSAASQVREYMISGGLFCVLLTGTQKKSTDARLHGHDRWQSDVHGPGLISADAGDRRANYGV